MVNCHWAKITTPVIDTAAAAAAAAAATAAAAAAAAAAPAAAVVSHLSAYIIGASWSLTGCSFIFWLIHPSPCLWVVGIQPQKAIISHPAHDIIIIEGPLPASHMGGCSQLTPRVLINTHTGSYSISH